MTRTFIHKLFHGLGKVGAASIAASLILTSFGPALDHHFPERNPFHLHLYPHTSSPPSSHSHPYQAPHSHTAHSHDSPESNAFSSETVYLSPSDGISRAVSMTPPIPAEQAPMYSDGGIADNLFPLPSDNLLQYTSHISLAKKPPRS
ncbi:MAG: hypothetical protein FJ320_04415 [SAR202 cluster bacterium]|nr:hypothetical protein [SAR202 cluster bacterium]